MHDRYGPPSVVLRNAEVPVPEPAAGEVLVQVAATTVHADVWHVVAGRPYAMRLMGNGVRRPRSTIPGKDDAGRDGGAWAELVCAPADGLVVTPSGRSDDEAVAVGTPGVLALGVLRDQGGMRPGLSVCVNGAAGAMGLQLVQLARALGASRVVGVDRPDTHGLLREFGCDATVDHTREDVTRRRDTVDLVLDVASPTATPTGDACSPTTGPSCSSATTGTASAAAACSAASCRCLRSACGPRSTSASRGWSDPRLGPSARSS